LVSDSDKANSGTYLVGDIEEFFWVMAPAPCATCKKDFKRADHALQCELCGLWEHLSCMRDIDRPSEELYLPLCKSQCNALWAVCSVCRSQGSLTKRVFGLESKLVVLEECSHTKELLFEEKEHLVDHLQTELIEVKADRDRLLQLLEQQKFDSTEKTT